MDTQKQNLKNKLAELKGHLEDYADKVRETLREPDPIEKEFRASAEWIKKELMHSWAICEKHFFIFENLDNVKKNLEQNADKKIQDFNENKKN